VTARMSPSDSWITSSAGIQLAGLPMRIAVAIVSGFVTGWPRTMGAAPAAWKPHILAVSCNVQRSVLREAPPVGGNVAGVADRYRQDVGRLAEHVDDLEGAGLLTLDAIGLIELTIVIGRCWVNSRARLSAWSKLPRICSTRAP